MIELTIDDMTCGSCVASITRVVKGLDADANVVADIARKRVRIESLIDIDAVVAGVLDGADVGSKRNGVQLLG